MDVTLNREPRLVDVDALAFDPENPRLPGADLSSARSAIEALVAEADVNELVQAIGYSGWLNYEPLVVLADGNVVLEGNRRLAALRIISDESLQREFGIFPPDSMHENAKPKQVRALFVDSPEEARDFIGFKHVNGPHKWDAYAKAKFAWQWISSDKGISLSDVAKRLGDGHNTVARLVNAYILLEQAIAIGFDMNARTKTQFAFSHLYTGLVRPSVREFLGIEAIPVNDLLPDKPVDSEHQPNLLEFLTLLYGQGEKLTVIGSQNPDLNRLVDVLANATATSMLLSDNDLKSAYAQVEDKSRRFAELIFNLNKAARAASEAAGDYSYDPDLQDMVQRVSKTVRALSAAMASEKEASQGETAAE